MKLSAWHKAQGDEVEFAIPLMPYDRIYMARVFDDTYTHDDLTAYQCTDVRRGGTGYGLDNTLPYEVEHMFPDYSLYGIKDTAYGFLTRGCPRGCAFCHVKDKEGRYTYKVADLNEFWNGQKNIVLCDPNILACKDWKPLLQQLIDSKAWVDINQGLDIRLMTEEKAEMIKQLKIKELHFAWDRYEDKDIVVPKFKMFKELTSIDIRKLIVFVLCGDREKRVLETDLERIYTLRDMGFWAYVMLYDKENIPKGHELRKLQRWVNNRFIFARCNTFEEYLRGNKDEQ
jgi:hypothetical protein